MMFTFQTTDKRIRFTNCSPKQVTDYWKANKKQLIWCLATEGTAPDYVFAYFWHEGHKNWNDLLSCDEHLKTACRRLLTKYYTEAFNNGMVLEYVARLDNQS